LLESSRVLAYRLIYRGFGFPLLDRSVSADVPVVAAIARGDRSPEVAGDAARLGEDTDDQASRRRLERVLTDDNEVRN